MNKIHAQGLDVWIGDVMIEIKIKNIRRGNGRAGFEHGKQRAACPIQRLDGFASFEIVFKEAGDLFGTVGGGGDGVALNLAEEGLGRANEEEKKDEG